MADGRRGRKKKELDEKSDDNKPQKLEYEVAKYLRNKLPLKRANLLGHKVDYFIASRAIDCLLDSKWAVKQKDEEPLFTTRESVVIFMQKMLTHQLFHRAKAIIVSKRKKKRDDESSAAEDHREKKKEKAKKEKTGSERDFDRDKSKEKLDKEKDDDEKDPDKDKSKEKEKKKEKKKIKLDMHMEQIFADGNEAYVWLYDPIPVRTWFFGALIVVAAVAVCLFPLWPKTFRSYVFYLSIAVATFLFTILVLVVLRLVIFVIVWLLTLGKHSFWILPNLTEDVGFFESFWPLYQYEYKGNKEQDEESKKKGNKDAEDNREEPVERSESDRETKEKQVEDTDDPVMHGAGDDRRKASLTNSENSSSSETGTRSSDNGFEILDTSCADFEQTKTNNTL